MPTDKGLRIWDGTDTGPVEVTDYEGNPIRIETMMGLTWYLRMVYFLRGRRQRKTALEKRKRKRN